MAGAYVQSGNSYTGGNATPALTGVASGNALLCVWLTNGSPGADPAVSSSLDGSLGTALGGGGGDTGGGRLGVHAKFGASSGSHTVTVDNGGAAVGGVLLEVSGLSAYDARSTLKDGFSSGPNSNTVTPSAAGNYLLGILTNNNADVLNSMTTLTERVDWQAARGIAIGDGTAASTSAVSLSGTLPGGSGFWYGQIYSFTVSGGGGATIGGPVFDGGRALSPGRIFGGSVLMRQALAFQFDGRRLMTRRLLIAPWRAAA